MQILMILLSSFFMVISYVLYAKAMLEGKAKPHRTTRLVLLLIISLSAASLFAQGSQVAVWLAGVSAFFSGIIFLMSLKYGMGGWSKIDILCLILALAGIVLWQTSQDPALALYLSIFADFTGMVPAIIKTYRFPKTEIREVFFLGALAAILNLMALDKWTIAEYSYPVYILFIDLLMAALIIRPKISLGDNKFYKANKALNI